jgi:hypothetical protein
MTSPLTVNIPHKLGTAEARRRLEGRFSTLADKIPGGRGARISERWDGDRMQFSVQAMGQEISGTVDVMDAIVRFELVLPPLLAGMAAMIRGPIEQAGQALLEQK